MSNQPSTRELEWHLIYSIIVAGKSQVFADGVMARLFPTADPPLDQVRWLIRNKRLAQYLRRCRTGNYGKLEKALRQLAPRGRFDLQICTADELEQVHGIGPKTARFFILWTRPGAKYAALDVHVLRWMRGLGYDAPKTTPGSPKVYRRLEAAFLAEADKRGVTPRELDHAIWVEAAQHPERSARTAELVKPVEVNV